MNLSTEQLTRIMPGVDPIWAPTYAVAATNTANKFQINTPLRMAAWLAIIAYESGQLQYWREIGQGGGAFGDYYGRGPLQLTWLENYQLAGAYLSLNLVADPDRVARDAQVGFDTAGWFWRHGNGDLNDFADTGDFWTCYLRVAGADNGTFNARKAFYDRALAVLKEEGGDVTEKPIWQTHGWFTWESPTSWNLIFYPPETTEPDKPEDFSWPEANAPPTAGNYEQRHPTRYTWREDVERWARYLVQNYDVSCNTYLDHPEGYGRDLDSIDVWGPGGRDDPIDPSLGDEIFSLLFNDPDKPDIDWLIWKEVIYGSWNGWNGEPFGDGSAFTAHRDHLHITYT